MKNSFCRVITLVFLITLTSGITRAQSANHSNPSVVRHTSGYYDHMSDHNNWGIFGLIGVIALAGLTKRNIPQKG